jgi:D-alanyl-D-alanine carboxypeptidase
LGKKIIKMTTILLIIFLLSGQIGIIAEANPSIPGLGYLLEEMTEEELWQAEQEAARAAWYNLVPESNEIPNWPQGPLVQAHSAIVMEVDTGAVLYAKNAHEAMYPASITKMLTLLIALQNSDFSDSIVFTEASMSMVRWEYAHIAMQVGEIISMEDALFGLMLASANEVAFAIAETVGDKVDGGGFDTFIRLMNEKSRELGTTNSNWANPTGLHSDNHYTTAYDMALIMSYLYHFPEYNLIMSRESYEIDETNITDEVRVLWQDHQMFNSPYNNFHHPLANGGKTGFTDQAGTTLVTTANNGEFSVIVVLMYAYGLEAYIGTAELFDYAFHNFSKFYVGDNALDGDVIEILDSNFYVMLPNHISFTELNREITLINDNNNIGIARYTYQGQVLGEVEVVVSEDYLERLEAQRLEAELSALEAERLAGEAIGGASDGTATEDGGPVRSIFLNIITIVAAVLIVIIMIVLALFIRGLRIARRRAKKRRRARRR